jgi:mono/diheme cytochrome c family protein
MHLRPFSTAVIGLALILLGAWGAVALQLHDWRLEPRQVGLTADALRLPDQAFRTQVSRGWQLVSAPLTTDGERGTLAVSDGLYWNFELRVLVQKEAEATPLVGFVLRYENQQNYGVLLWDTASGALTLRALRQNRPMDLGHGRALFGKNPRASLVLRAVMDRVACYVNGQRELTASDPSFLGRAAVFALGGEAIHLDGLEVRSLDTNEADADVFGRSRAVYETKCASCHELDGPWNSNFAPDDWESVVNEMLYVEEADEFITRREADRITDYLRIISLHSDRNHYRPAETP